MLDSEGRGGTHVGEVAVVDRAVRARDALQLEAHGDAALDAQRDGHEELWAVVCRFQRRW